MPPKKSRGAQALGPSDAQVSELIRSQKVFLQGLQASRTGVAPRAPSQQARGTTGWTCLFDDCTFASARKVNFSTNAVCKGCCRPKAHAMNPPRHMRIAPAEPTRSLRAKAKAQSGPATTDHAAPPPSRTVAVIRRSDTAAVAAEEELGAVGTTFKDVLAAKLPVHRSVATGLPAERLGIAPLADFDVDSLFKLPPAMPQKIPTAEELVANEQPLRTTADLEAQKAEVRSLEQALSLLPEGSKGRASLVAILTEQQTLLDKLLKKAPGTLLQIEKLRSARQAQKEQFTLLHERAETGKVNAAKGIAALLAEIDTHVALVTERRKAVVTAYDKADRAWDGFHAARRQQWDHLLVQFDAKVHELEAAPLVEMVVDAVQAPQIAAAGVAPPLAPADPLALAQQDGAAAQNVVAAAQEAQRQAMVAAAAVPPHLRTFACDLSEIPDALPQPNDTQWAQLHVLWVALETLERHEGVTGTTIPISFDGLTVATEVPKLLTGEVLWKRAFPDGEPDGKATVTWQLRCIMKESMQKHRAKLVADRAAHAAAEEQTSPSIVASVRDYRAKRHCTGIAVAALPSGA